MAGAIAAVDQDHIGNVVVRTTPCVVCHKSHSFILDREAYERWQAGELIQRAFPAMNAADREILISGTCGECFDRLWEE